MSRGIKVSEEALPAGVRPFLRKGENTKAWTLKRPLARLSSLPGEALRHRASLVESHLAPASGFISPPPRGRQKQEREQSHAARDRPGKHTDDHRRKVKLDGDEAQQRSHQSPAAPTTAAHAPPTAQLCSSIAAELACAHSVFANYAVVQGGVMLRLDELHKSLVRARSLVCGNPPPFAKEKYAWVALDVVPFQQRAFCGAIDLRHSDRCRATALLVVVAHCEPLVGRRHSLAVRTPGSVEFYDPHAVLCALPRLRAELDHLGHWVHGLSVDGYDCRSPRKIDEGSSHVNRRAF
eukprot:scaffold7738_cov107-Isochrysis_galbana.AAC.24